MRGIIIAGLSAGWAFGAVLAYGVADYGQKTCVPADKQIGAIRTVLLAATWPAIVPMVGIGAVLFGAPSYYSCEAMYSTRVSAADR